ncbi:MAG: hypothetical protein ACK55Z_37315 [bacterium]
MIRRPRRWFDRAERARHSQIGFGAARFRATLRLVLFRCETQRKCSQSSAACSANFITPVYI